MRQDSKAIVPRGRRRRRMGIRWGEEHQGGKKTKTGGGTSKQLETYELWEIM